MSISRRQRFGALLVAISVLAAIAYVVADVNYALAHGHARIEGFQTSQDGTATSFAVHVDSSISECYLIPIILCGAVGLLFLAWPYRKPPMLQK